MRDTDKDKETKELLAEIERLKRIAYRDELTGLYNRYGLKDTLFKFIGAIKKLKDEENQRKSVFIKDIALIIFDIDDFKKLNDTFGHPAGDEALKLFSIIIGKNIRDIDLATRWGGEEMVVALIGANEGDAFRVADSIRGDMERAALEFKGKEIKFTVSGGVARFDENLDLEENLGNVDKALYEAKRSGKNKILSASELA